MLALVHLLWLVAGVRAHAGPARPLDLCGAMLAEPLVEQVALDALARAPDVEAPCTVWSYYRKARLPTRTSGPGVLIWVVFGGILGSRSYLESPPLHLAVAAGSPRLVTALLARGAARSTKDSQGNTADDLALTALGSVDPVVVGDPLATARALFVDGPPRAAKVESKELLALLTSGEAAAIVCPPGQPLDWTVTDTWELRLALCEAVEARAANLVERVLACGARGGDSCREADAVVLAARTGDERSVRALLAETARPRPYTRRYGLPEALESALRADEVEAAAFLGGLGASLTDANAANAAAHGPNGRSVAWLLAQGRPVDTRDVNGRTPVHFAATFGGAATLRALLEACVDPSVFPEGDRSALETAARMERPEHVRILLDAGAPLGRWAEDWVSAPTWGWERDGAERAVLPLLIEAGLRGTPRVVRALQIRGLTEQVDRLRERPRRWPARPPCSAK